MSLNLRMAPDMDGLSILVDLNLNRFWITISTPLTISISKLFIPGSLGFAKKKGRLVILPKKLNQKEYAQASCFPFKIYLVIKSDVVKKKPAINENVIQCIAYRSKNLLVASL